MDRATAELKTIVVDLQKKLLEAELAIELLRCEVRELQRRVQETSGTTV